MAEHEVVVRLNQQQQELIDKTIGRGEAADVEELFKRALHEYWDQHFGSEPEVGA